MPGTNLSILPILIHLNLNYKLESLTPHFNHGKTQVTMMLDNLFQQLVSSEAKVGTW